MNDTHLDRVRSGHWTNVKKFHFLKSYTFQTGQYERHRQFHLGTTSAKAKFEGENKRYGLGEIDRIARKIRKSTSDQNENGQEVKMKCIRMKFWN